MSATNTDVSQPQYSVVHPAPHSLHECHYVEPFRERFEAQTGCRVQDVANDVIATTAPKAIFAVGSLPLGMGSSGSDVDLIVLIEDRAALMEAEAGIVNTDQRLGFSSDSDSLLAAEYLTLHNGIVVDLQVAITPEIIRIYQRLRRRGPELSENEIRILGRLNCGWLLWETAGFLEKNGVTTGDSTFAVCCCTKKMVSALIQRRKAGKALELQDIPLAMQHGRNAIEEAYLAYFASEGLAYLGTKWLAQIGHARGARERLARHPLLAQGVPLLFPQFGWTATQTARYLQEVTDCLQALQALIEQKLLFRIAFKACPQITSA